MKNTLFKFEKNMWPLPLCIHRVNSIHVLFHDFQSMLLQDLVSYKSFAQARAAILMALSIDYQGIDLAELVELAK